MVKINYLGTTKINCHHTNEKLNTYILYYIICMCRKIVLWNFKRKCPNYDIKCTL